MACSAAFGQTVYKCETDEGVKFGPQPCSETAEKIHVDTSAMGVLDVHGAHTANEAYLRVLGYETDTLGDIAVKKEQSSQSSDAKGLDTDSRGDVAAQKTMSTNSSDAKGLGADSRGDVAVQKEESTESSNKPKRKDN